MTIDVHFLDAGRAPQTKPDPKYPEGKHIDLTTNMLAPRCGWNVPWPAPGCGTYVISCRDCGARVTVPVAGRADDPNGVTIPCKR